MGHSFQQYSFVTSVASVFNFQTPYTATAVVRLTRDVFAASNREGWHTRIAV